MDSGGYPGCSRHLGEFIQSHCATCNQILCLKCLTTGHCGHDVKNYDDFLRDRREEAEAQVQRLKIIRQRVENQKVIFSKLRADLEDFYEKTDSELESYKVVQDGMKEWKKNLKDELERKKSQQLQNLDMAVCNPDSKSLIIKIPKISVDKRAELVSDVQMKVRELTPGSIHFLTGRSQLRYSLSLNRIYRNCVSLYENIEPNDTYDDILTKDQLEDYKEKHMSPQSNEQQKTTGYVNVDEMHKQNELPPPLPPKPSCSRSHTGKFKHPCPLPRSKLLHRSSKDTLTIGLPSPSNIISWQSQPTNDGMHREQQSTNTTVPNKQSPEIQSIYSINDTSNLQKPSPPRRTPSPIHQGFVMEGNPSYEVSYLKQDAEEFDDDTLYEEIEDTSKVTLVPVINPQNEPNEVYEDMAIVSSRSPNIITYGCLAETPGESIDLYDVCVNPQGCLIFSDPTNSCLRILMDTTKSSERMTKRLKDDIQPWAVTYDSSNQRIIFGTKTGLSQLQFGDGKLKKIKEKKSLKFKGISPKFISCTSTSNKGERINVCATILPRGRERSIQCYDENGDFCRELEVAKMPSGIDHCREYLVLATLQDGCLTKITHYGQSLWSNEVDAQKPGILQEPFGVVILPNEYIAVTESNAHRVSIFSSEGKLVLRLGSHGSEPGMFNTPRGIAVRHSKELVVIDSGNNRIQIFSLNSIL